MISGADEPNRAPLSARMSRLMPRGPSDLRPPIDSGSGKAMRVSLATLVFLVFLGLLGWGTSASAQDPNQPYLQPPTDGAPPPPPLTAPPGQVADPNPPVPGQTTPAPEEAPPAASDPQAPPPYQPQPYQAPQATPASQPPPPPRPLPAQEPQGRTEFVLPGMSFRMDPFEMLLEGRFGPQLEVEVFEFMTFELVPLFFLTDSPFVLDLTGFVGRKSEITQHSNGLGPLVGASAGVGFWLGGRPFRGYVLRAMLTNFGVKYRSHFDGDVIDEVTFTERRFQVLLESMTRFGIFTINSGIGIGYELNPKDRCDLSDRGGGFYNPQSTGCGELQIMVSDGGGEGPVNLQGPLGRWSIVGRLSIGLTFD